MTEHHGNNRLRRDSLNLLYDINEYINHTNDAAIILQGVLKKIKDFFNFSLINLYLWNNEAEKLLLKSTTGWKEDARQKTASGLTEAVYSSKQPLIITNIRKHFHYKNDIPSNEQKLTSYLGIPVLLMTNCIGVLEFWNEKNRRIPAGRQKLLRIITARISGLLEASEVIDRLKETDLEPHTSRYYGFPISKGIATGKAFIIPELLQNNNLTITPGTDFDREKEKAKIEEAFAGAIAEMEVLINTLKESGRIMDSEINIFQAHLLILQDLSFKEEIIQNIETKRMSAEISLSEHIEKLMQNFKKIDDPYFKDRAFDIKDIGTRLMNIIQGQSPETHLVMSLPRDSIVVAEYLSPSLLVSFDKSKIKGIITEKGGRSSHTAILAQSLGIPAVSEIMNINHLIPEGTDILLDGNIGTVFINPDEETLAEYRSEIKRRDELINMFAKKRETCGTGDTTIASNVSFLHDIQWAKKYGIESVGLYRSEFFYMGYNAWPGINEQVEIYLTLASSFTGQVVIRLLDVGADKTLPYLRHTKEENPLLGLRSVRFLLKNMGILQSQLKAIFTAFKKFSNISILIPMVTTLDELLAVKEISGQIAKELNLKHLPLIGVMLEVPAVIYQISELGKEADFFSIGTNDLLQYFLAVDRESNTMGSMYSGYQPAFLRMMYELNGRINETGKKVTVCGELSGTPFGAMYLRALGFKDLSLYPAKAPVIRYLSSFLTENKLAEIRENILSFKDIKTTVDYLNQTLIAFDPLFAEVVATASP